MSALINKVDSIAKSIFQDKKETPKPKTTTPESLEELRWIYEENPAKRRLSCPSLVVEKPILRRSFSCPALFQTIQKPESDPDTASDSGVGLSLSRDSNDVNDDPLPPAIPELFVPPPAPPLIIDPSIPPISLINGEHLTTKSALANIFMGNQDHPKLEALYEIAKEGGSFEQAVRRHLSSTFGVHTISFASDNAFLDVSGKHLALIRTIKHPFIEDAIIKATYTLSLDANFPDTGFSVDLSAHDWKVCKFTTMFHHLKNATRSRTAINPSLQQTLKTIEEGTNLSRTPDATFETARTVWKQFVKEIEICCEITSLNLQDTELLKNLVSAVYESPQYSLFKTLYPAILRHGTNRLDVDAGLEPSCKAIDYAKKSIGLPKNELPMQSLGAGIGHFEPLLDGRLPFYIKSFYLCGREIRFYSMSSPTREYRSLRGSHISLTPLFEYWTREIMRNHFYLNLQSRLPYEITHGGIFTPAKRLFEVGAATVGIADESQRALAVERCKTIKKASLPSDGSFYHQTDTPEEIPQEEFKTNLNLFFTDTSPSSRVYLPHLNERSIFQEIITLIHEAIFDSKASLNNRDREVYIEIEKAFLALVSVIELEPDSSNLTCKDGIDRAGMLLALVSLLLLIMQDKENDVDALLDIVTTLHAATFLAKGQAITTGSNRRQRLFDCWSALGFSLTELRVENPERIKRIKAHPIFQKLKAKLFPS